MNEQRRLLFFIPNIFTALNMACGFASTLFAWQGELYKASMFLLLGSLFDMVDGKVARLTGTQSTFGEEFDSLSDVVSFGLAPAILVYCTFFNDLGRIGFIIPFFFLLAGALRLARFNANIDRVSSDYFQGLPIPLAALSLVGLVLWTIPFPEIKEWNWSPGVYVLFFAILMISNIPFASFKSSPWAKKHKKQVLFLIFLILTSLFLNEELMVGVFTSAYVVISLIYYLFKRNEFKGIFEWKNESENESNDE